MLPKTYYLNIISNTLVNYTAKIIKTFVISAKILWRKSNRGVFYLNENSTT